MYLRGAVVCIPSEVNKKEDKCHFKIFKKITRDRSNRFSTASGQSWEVSCQTGNFKGKYTDIFTVNFFTTLTG